VAGLVVNTCTGYLCPGLSSYLAEDLGLPASIRHLDLMGMGCGAALPNLEAACGLLARGAEGPVLSVAVEICSATIFPAHEPDLVVSNCIFGDGAAAAVVERAGAGRAPALAILREYEGVLQPDHREDLRYRTQGGLLRNSLSRRVPVIGATAAKEAAGRLLARQGLSRENIAWWAVHPGGTVVLDQVEKALDLEAGALRFSRQVFEEYGNMSSPSVLFVLRKMLDSGELKPGDQGMLLAFGAGFSAFALQVEF
jgi:alkylresorcinol/alkylpyrone synthase